MKMEIMRTYLPDIGNPQPYFHCKDEKGKDHIVDIWVDGTMPADTIASDCIGKFIECDYLHAYTEIASNPRFVENSSRESLKND